MFIENIVDKIKDKENTYNSSKFLTEFKLEIITLNGEELSAYQQ